MAENKYHVGGSAAELYQRNMVRRIFAPWAARLLEIAAIEPGERVLDVACGTGAVARLAAAAAGRSGAVTGLDINPAMLDVARGLAPVEGAAIEWVESDATDIALPDAAFDAVLCQQGLQFIPDKPAALGHMHRVLAQGGRLAATVWRPIRHAPGHQAVADAVAEFVGADAAATRRAPFEFNDRETLRGLVRDAGFSAVAVRVAAQIVRFDSGEDLVRSMMAGTPLAPFMADAGPETVAGVIDMVSRRTRDYEDDDGIALPTQAWVVTATA